ncbi:MAG: hypothetical protein PHY64_12165, partial [Eubacteriales bacterium]|nr:hypothetical protein [Eubacteriales bacterium]
MAIVEMKHVDMLALKKDRHALLYEIQKLGCFQLLPSDAEDVSFNRTISEKDLPSLEDALTRVSWAIGKLHRYDKTKKPLMADKPSIDETQAQTLLGRQPELMKIVERLEMLEREAGDLRGQTARMEATREQLLPWQNFALAPDEVHSTRNTVAMLGTVQLSAVKQWQENGGLGDLCDVEQVSEQRDLAYVYILMHRSNQEQVMRQLKEANFSAVTLPQSHMSVAEQLKALDHENVEIETKQNTVIGQISDLAVNIGDLQQLFDILNSKRERLLASKNFSQSESTFFLQGWVPAPMTEKIEKKLTKVAPTVALSFYDPEPGEEPPVVLQNAPVMTPFESV